LARTAKIVDTNVCVTANRPPGTDLQCASNCANELKEVVKRGLLVIDSAGEVFREYRRHLAFSGQPGFGDLLFKWLVDNRHRTDRVTQVALTPHAEREADYAEFPDDPALDGFDRDDRVFVALARAHPQRPAILNAVDSDYWHYREPLTGHGVKVIHVCGHGHYKPRANGD
jgi:hypothetical protein